MYYDSFPLWVPTCMVPTRFLAPMAASKTGPLLLYVTDKLMNAYTWALDFPPCIISHE